MTLEKATLDNGLTIYNDHLPGALTNGVTMFVPYGSVNENIGDEGAAHAFEHCVFLKTDKFENELAINRHAKLNGMYINAETGFTGTSYQADGLSLEPNLAHLSQIIQHTHLPEGDVKHEMKAVRREAYTALDDIDDRHDTAASYAMFGAPYGRDIIGYHDKLDFSASKLRQLHDRYYKIGQMSLVVSGMATLDEVVGLADRYFHADDTPYSQAHTKDLPVTLGEHTTTGMLCKNSQNVRMSVSYPLSPEFREQYVDNQLALDIARFAISDACFNILRMDKGISYDGGVTFRTDNHPNAHSLTGYATTDKENVKVAKDVFTDIFSRDDTAFSDDDLTGSLAMFTYAYSHSLPSRDNRISNHIERLELYLEPEDVDVDIARLKTLQVADIRAAINQITEFTANAPKYTHLTGKRSALGDIEHVISPDEIG